MPLKIPVNGAGKPGNDYILEPTFAEGMVESLQQQRAKYADLGDTKQVSTIDEQIAYYRSSDAPQSAGYAIVDQTGAPLAIVVSEREPELVDPLSGETIVSTEPALTEPGCTHPDCVLMHPHAGPAVLSADAAREAGLVQDRKSGSWRAPRPPGRPAGE